MLLTILIILTIIIGAILGRMDGGGIIKTPEIVERSLIMLFFVLACIPFAGWWSIIAIIGMVGIATGHGQFFLALVVKFLGDTKERVDIIVRLFFGKDPRTHEFLRFEPKEDIQDYMTKYGIRKLYWRSVFGMFCTGFLVGLPAAILAFVFHEPLIGLVFLQTGTVKALAYVLGYELFKNTESAEYLNGGMRNALCVIAYLLF